MCDCRKADIIQIWGEKNTSWKHSLHDEAHRIQLECPYNSSNETKIPMYDFLRFFCSLHKLEHNTFLYIRTCARGREYKCAISLIQQCIATQCFIPWMNQVLNIQYWVSQRFSGPFRRSHLFRFYWISRFERIVWSEWFRHLLKQGHAATYWRFYCIFIYPKNQLRCQHKKHIQQNII